jgi:hypothetical protein
MACRTRDQLAQRYLEEFAVSFMGGLQGRAMISQR